MSLVYEALQKAEREKGRKTGNAPVVPSPVVVPKPVVPVATPAARSYLLPLIAVVSLVAIVAIVYLVAVATRNTPATVAVPAPPPSDTKPADLTEQVPPTGAAALPSPSVANDAQFKLTGIMKMGESYGAVLNGRVVYESFYVDGATVKKIEKDRVTLTINGRDVVVRLF